jgi:hypothetical protein
MTREQLWQIITDRNPQFVTQPCTLTPAGLKKLFDTAWEQGHEQGLANGRALQMQAARGAHPFDRIFGEWAK